MFVKKLNKTRSSLGESMLDISQILVSHQVVLPPFVLILTHAGCVRLSVNHMQDRRYLNVLSST